MSLIEYIEKRQEELDKQLEKIYEQETVNIVAIAIVNSGLAELLRIKVAVEDGVIGQPKVK